MKEINFSYLFKYSFSYLPKIITLIGDDEGQIFMVIKIIINMFLINNKSVFKISYKSIFIDIYKINNLYFYNNMFFPKKVIIINNIENYSYFLDFLFYNICLKNNNKILYIINCKHCEKTFSFFRKIRDISFIINCYTFDYRKKLFFLYFYFNINKVICSKYILERIINCLSNNIFFLINELNKIILLIDNGRLDKKQLFICNDNTNFNIFQFLKFLILQEKHLFLEQIKLFFKFKDSCFFILEKLISIVVGIIYIHDFFHQKENIKHVIYNYKVNFCFLQTHTIINICQNVDYVKIFCLLIELIQLKVICQKDLTKSFNYIINYFFTIIYQ